MNKIEEKKIELIETLMEQKNFSELNKAEKELVLETLKSELEYDRMKELSIHLASYIISKENSPLPRPEILEKIKSQRFTKPQSQMSTFKKMLTNTWSLPVYQVTATAAAVFIFIFFMIRNETSPAPSPRVLVEKVFVHDTVQVAQPKDTVFIEKYIYRQSGPSAKVLVRLDEGVRMDDHTGFINAEDYLEQVNQHKGYNLEEKDFLLTLNVDDE